jgi:ankyrin repeat protein
MRILFFCCLVKGVTALLLSSEYGHLEVVRALLQGGANVNAATNKVRERA